MKSAVLVLSIFCAATAHANAQECNKIHASAHPDYPPYHWNDNGKIVGASVDLHQIIFDELNIPFEAKYHGPWKRVLFDAEQGRIDLVMALKKTPTRQQFLNFTEDPVFPNPFSVFVTQSSTFTFNNWQDLIGKYGGKNAGDRYGQKFDEYLAANLQVHPAKTPEHNFKKLISNRIDYFIHSRYSGAAFLTTFAQGDQVQILDKNINEGFIHSGFSKQSTCSKHLTYMNQRYQELMADGTASKLLNQNLKRWKSFVERNATSSE